MNIIKVAVVDDHKMVSKAIANMIVLNPQFEVVITSSNGEEFLETLKKTPDHPDVVLMDINMPFKNGIETTEILSKLYPRLKVIALTMEDNETTIIKMMRAGARGYLLKDMTTEMLFDAIETVNKFGSFYTDFLSQKISKIKEDENKIHSLLNDLTDNELEFLKLACSELTYKQIADEMCLSPKTIDGYRNSLFAKFDVKSRVGIVLFANKNNLL